MTSKRYGRVARIGGFVTTLLLVAGGASGCGDEPASDGTVHSDASRVKEYTSLTELDHDAKLIVVGRLSGPFKLNPYYGDKETPFAMVDFAVEETLKGKARPGESVQLSLEAGLTKDGKVSSDKLSADETYLLYLVPQGPKSPSTYTIVGYLAGIFVKATSDEDSRSVNVFARADEESPKLPEEIVVDDVLEAAN